MSPKPPIIVICQGRTGGTALADILARMADGLLLIEPLHPHLGATIEKNPARTHTRLGHRIRQHPFADYRLYPKREILNRSGDALLRYLACEAPRRPVMKVCRAWGQIAELRRAVPEAKLVHLWRDFYAIQQSMKRAGIPEGYLGEPGHTPGDAWSRARHEGWAHADVSVPYEALKANPAETLGILAVTLGLPPEAGIEWANLVT